MIRNNIVQTKNFKSSLVQSLKKKVNNIELQIDLLLVKHYEFKSYHSLVL